MKASPTISLLGLGLLSLVQCVIALSWIPANKTYANYPIPGSGIKGPKDDEWVPPENPATNDVFFSWCRDYNMTSTCAQATLKHGWCCRCFIPLLQLASFANYWLADDLAILDPAIIDQLEDVGASAGRCMLFR